MLLQALLTSLVSSRGDEREEISDLIVVVTSVRLIDRIDGLFFRWNLSAPFGDFVGRPSCCW